MTTERRDIDVAKNIALHHIYSQAGTLEKAFLEQIMNAADAGASQVIFTLDEDSVTYSIKDNGSGFPDRESILKNFEVLGFDHATPEEAAKQRKFGTFGLGRAQLWAWSRNTWRTNQFVMTVDLEKNGLTYEFTETEDHVSGCLVEGELYTPLTAFEKGAVVRSLAELAKYAPVEVHFNGNIISRSLESMDWTAVTDDAYIKTRESGQLKVYNQGIYVCSYPASRFGVSGVVVSKSNLTLNVARNDVMLNRCEVFARIQDTLSVYAANRKNKTSKSMTPSDKVVLFTQILQGSESVAEYECKKIIKASDAKWYSIADLLSGQFDSYCFAPKSGMQRAENIHRSMESFVFSDQFVRDLEMDHEDICRGIERIYHEVTSQRRDLHLYKNTPFRHYSEISDNHSCRAEFIDESKIKGRKACAWKALKLLNEKLQGKSLRALRAGQLEGAEAWTDGSSYIGISPDFVLKLMDKGGNGVLYLAHVLLHEYAHETSTDTDHAHDLEFFERYHELTMYLTDPRSNTGLHDISAWVTNRYASLLIDKVLKVPNLVVRTVEYASSGHGCAQGYRHRLQKLDMLIEEQESEDAA